MVFSPHRVVGIAGTTSGGAGAVVVDDPLFLD
jgi:hypothetical protein